MRRVKEPFAGVNGGEPKASSTLQSYTSLDKQSVFVSICFGMYPLAKDQFSAYEDKSYFLNIAQRSGQMPVSFILILEDSFGVWITKVLFCLSYPRETKLILSYRTLWVSEDIEVVFDQDPQRVVILQYLIAVRHSIKKDEPIKEIPVLDYLGVKSSLVPPSLVSLCRRLVMKPI